jgi:hypothetical protein
MRRLVNERLEFAITDATARIQDKLLSLLQSLGTIVERRGILMQEAHLAFLAHIGINAATIPIYVGSSGGSIPAPQELRANAQVEDHMRWYARASEEHHWKNSTLCPRKSKHFVSMCEREKPAYPSVWKPMYRTLVHKGRFSMHAKRALSIPCEP